MKFLIYNDIRFVIRNHKNIYFWYGISIILYFTLKISIKDSLVFDAAKDSLGVQCSLDNADIMQIIMYILNVGIYAYIALNIFIKDIKNGVDNIFLRVGTLRWVTIKVISILLISTVLHVMTIILIVLMFYPKNFDLHLIYNIFTKKILYISIVQNISLIFLMFSIVNKYIIIIFPLLLMLFCQFIPTNMLSIGYTNYGIIIIVLYVLILAIFSSLYVTIFERINGG
jgi:hypothetical protein